MILLDKFVFGLSVINELSVNLKRSVSNNCIDTIFTYKHYRKTDPLLRLAPMNDSYRQICTLTAVIFSCHSLLLPKRNVVRSPVDNAHKAVTTDTTEGRKCSVELLKPLWHSFMQARAPAFCKRRSAHNIQ